MSAPNPFEFSRAELRQILDEELREVLQRNHGKLTDADARKIADLLGYRSLTPVRDAQRRILREPDFVLDSSLNVVQRLALYGQRGFVLDDMFWTLYFWLGEQKAVLDELRRALEPLGMARQVPDEATLSRWLSATPSLLADAPRHGLDNLHKRCLFTRSAAYDVDELWECDEVIVDIGVRHPRYRKRTVRLHVLLLVDVASGFIRAAAFMPHPFRASDFLALIAEAAEPLLVGFGEAEREVGRLPIAIIVDNAKAFTATKNDDTFLRIAELTDAMPGYFVSLPGIEAHSPYAWWQKPYVEGEANSFQRELLRGLPNRFTFAKRLNDTDAHSQPFEHQLSWDVAVGLAMLAIDRRNHSDRGDGLCPADVYATFAQEANPLPDEQLAELYQPHWRDNGTRKVSEKGVSIDGSWWAGDGLDIGFEDAGWRFGEKAKPQIGDTVEVRVLNHRRDPLAYLPKISPDREALSYEGQDLPVLRRRYDRAAIFYDGAFTGWVHHGVTPEEVRDEILANRAKTIRYVTDMQGRSRQSARNLGAQIDAGRGDSKVTAVASESVDPSEVDDAPRTVGEDPAVEGARPGRRPPTRRSGKGNGRTSVPASRRRRAGLDALADSNEIDLREEGDQ